MMIVRKKVISALDVVGVFIIGGMNRNKYRDWEIILCAAAGTRLAH